MNDDAITGLGAIAPAVLFVNIGWSEAYDGQDPVQGNHEFLRDGADDCAESYAFVPTEDGLYRCGIGRGSVDAARLDVVFVARPPGESGHRVVCVYFDVRWDESDGGWVTASTKDVLMFDVDDRMPVDWPGRMSMRRWASRGGAPGTEHPHLHDSYRQLLDDAGRRPGDSTWDETPIEPKRSDEELLEQHVKLEGDPTADVRPFEDLRSTSSQAFARSHFAALDPVSVELTSFAPGMNLGEALRKLLAHPKLESVRLTAFRGNRGFFEMVGLSELIASGRLRFDRIRMMFAPPNGLTLDLAKWLEAMDRGGKLEAREFPMRGGPREMHVKLLLLEFRGGRRVAVTGSANATTAALRSNEELSVAFSPSHDLGVSDPFRWFDDAWEEAPRLVALNFLEEQIEVHRRALFPFQLEAQSALSRRLGPLLEDDIVVGGHGGGLLVLPTGAGKTLTAMRWIFNSALVPDAEGRRPKVLWMSHRRELLQHAYDAAKHELLFVGGSKPDVIAYGIDEGATPSWEPWERGDLVFISSQRAHSALRRFQKSRKRKIPAVDLIVVDEAHRASASTKQYGDLLQELPHRARLGLTATPYRGALSDIRKFAELFTLPDDRGRGRPTALFQRTRKEIEEVPLPGGAKLFAKEHPLVVETGYRLRLEAQSEAQFFQKHIRKFNAPARNEKVVDTYFDHALHVGPTLVFAVSRDHANDLATMINRRGGRAHAFHEGEIPRAASLVPLHGVGMDLRERAEVLARFREGQIKVLTCVQLLTEGLDVPNIAAVLLARPTMSTLLLTQMIGRGLRGPAVGGAETCLVVDFADQLTIHQKRHKHHLRVATLEDARRFWAGHEAEVDALPALS